MNKWPKWMRNEPSENEMQNVESERNNTYRETTYMRRIALLEIVVDDRYNSSGYCPPEDERLPHKVVLSIHDIVTFRKLGMTEEEINTSLPSVLAHELGHFVAVITGVSSHKGLSSSAPDPPHVKMQRERDAWALAEKMIPIQQNTKAACLKSYSNLYELSLNDIMKQWNMPTFEELMGKWTVQEK